MKVGPGLGPDGVPPKDLPYPNGSSGAVTSSIAVASGACTSGAIAWGSDLETDGEPKSIDPKAELKIPVRPVSFFFTRFSN